MLFFIPLSASAIGIDEIMEHGNRDIWYTGKTLGPGDSFVYLICDNTSHRLHHLDCYQLRMDFYIELKSEKRNVWIVQAEFSDEHHTVPHIFLIDSDTLHVTADAAAGSLADSVENTLFYLAQFTTKYSPKQLELGEVWAEIPSTVQLGSELIVANRDVIEIDDGHTFDIHLVRYGLFESSIFAISPNLPFPAYAVAYNPYHITSDPPVLFSIELLEYTSGRSEKKGELELTISAKN